MSVSLLNNNNNNNVINTNTNPISTSPTNISSLESSTVNTPVDSDLAYSHHSYSHSSINNTGVSLHHFHAQQQQQQQNHPVNIHANYQINKRFKTDQCEFSNFQYINSQASNINQQLQHSPNENINNSNLNSAKKPQQVFFFLFDTKTGSM